MPSFHTTRLVPYGADEMFELVTDVESYPRFVPLCRALRVRRRDENAYQWAADVMFEVRKQRSEAKQPLRVPITAVTVKADAGALAMMPIVEADLRAALRVKAFTTMAGEPREIRVEGYESVAS